MAESIVLPEEINEETVKAMDEQTIDEPIADKEFIASIDLIFGDGTFEKVYEKYPDIMALEDIVGASRASCCAKSRGHGKGTP